MQASGLEKLTALTFLRLSYKGYTREDMQSLKNLKQMRRLELSLNSDSKKGKKS